MRNDYSDFRKMNLGKDGKYTVTCPVCGESRKVSETVMYKILRGRLTARCRDCALEHARSQKTYEVKRRSRTQRLEVNGCVLMPAQEGRRCENHEHCPHYEECLDAIALRDWAGWQVVSELECVEVV